MDRREFIKAVEAAALCGSAAGLLAGCAGLAYLTPVVERDRLLVPLADLGERAFALVRHPGSDRPIYLHRHEDGSFSAVSTRCTHKGCQVEPAGSVLACPCHGSEYTLRGEVTEGPAQRSLQAYPVAVEGGRVVIRLHDPGTD